MEKYWIIGHKEMHPKIIPLDKNYYGDNKPYRSIKEIKIDLGDRFLFAEEYTPTLIKVKDV